MSGEENKALIRRYVEEVYNQQDIDAARTFIDESMPDSGIDHLQQFFNAFPDSHTTLLDLFGEGEKVVAYLFMTATNKGPFAGQPPTGKKVEFHSIRIYRIVNNKIVESWAMQDRLGLMEQLGFVRAAGEVNWGGSVTQDE